MGRAALTAIYFPLFVAEAAAPAAPCNLIGRVQTIVQYMENAGGAATVHKPEHANYNSGGNTQSIDVDETLGEQFTENSVASANIFFGPLILVERLPGLWSHIQIGTV